MITGDHKGERLGACTDCRRMWGKFRAAEISEQEIGEINNAKPLPAQEHFVGPVARGEFPLGGTRKLEYNVGYLFGLTDNSPNGEVKFELAYEWRF